MYIQGRDYSGQGSGISKDAYEIGDTSQRHFFLLTMIFKSKVTEKHIVKHCHSSQKPKVFTIERHRQQLSYNHATAEVKTACATIMQ